jgi:hypothetical protein
MKNQTFLLYKNHANLQRPCAATLRRTLKWRDWESDFRGRITLEDGRVYAVGVYVATDSSGETVLRLYLRPPSKVSKTPVTPGRLEVVRP